MKIKLLYLVVAIIALSACHNKTDRAIDYRDSIRTMAVNDTVVTYEGDTVVHAPIADYNFDNIKNLETFFDSRSSKHPLHFWLPEETTLNEDMKEWRSLNFPWQAPEVLTKRWCNMIQDRTSFCTFAPMKKEPTTINKDFIISFFLPDGMTDWFEIVGMREEPNGGTAQADVLYSSVLHIYLDERDNRIGDQLGLKPNGFTEATVIKDYPIRNRKVLLHVRRRRYLDADGRNIILNQYPLTADGTKLSVEFGLFFKDGDGQPSVDGSVIGKILSY